MRECNSSRHFKTAGVFKGLAGNVLHLQNYLPSAIVSRQLPKRNDKHKLLDRVSLAMEGSSSDEDDEDYTETRGPESDQEVEHSSDASIGEDDRASRPSWSWGSDEDKKLKSLKKAGESWKMITKALRPRSEGAVKIRWYKTHNGGR